MSDLEFAKEKINLLSYITGTAAVKAKRIKDKQYRINPCPICGHKDHFTVFTDTNSYSSFSNCCNGGSIIDYLQEYEGLDLNDAIKRAKEIAGLQHEKNQPINKEFRSTQPKIKKDSQPQNKRIPSKDHSKSTNNFTELIKELSKNKTDYYYNRGLTDNIIHGYLLGYSNDGFNYAIKHAGLAEEESDLMKAYKYFLPVMDPDGEIHYFITRLDDNSIPEGIKKPMKTHNLKGYSARIFNDRYITGTETGKYIFVTEGIFDALSLEEFGYNAIALNSTANANLFIELVKNNLDEIKEKIFIAAGDNDSAGQSMNTNIKDALESLGLAVEIYKSPKQYKDINEHLKDNRDSLNQRLAAFIKNIESQDMVCSYLVNYIDEIIKTGKKQAISTGFKQLDNFLDGGLYSGLYALGAISSLGKTTFILQVSDYIAANKHDVLFFSLEMSKFEVVSKTLSRITTSVKIDNAATTRQIMQGNCNFDILKAAWDIYNKGAAQHMAIIEGVFNTGVAEIRKRIDKHIKYRGRKPVVVIDYLQILRPMSDRMSDKQANDYNVTEIKRISRDYDIPVIIISSFNRENYTAQVSFESFKETGAIEYTSDVVIGMQLANISEITQTKDQDKKKLLLNQAKAAHPRQVELVILKNRNGAPFGSWQYEYYSKNNLFAEKL